MQESDFNEIMENLKSQKHRLADFDIYLTSRDSRTGIQSVSMRLSGHTCSTENTCMRYIRRIYLEIVSALAMIIISTLILSSCTCYVCILPPGTFYAHFRGWLFENDRNRYSTKKVQSWPANFNNGLNLTDRSIPSCLSNLSNLHLIWCRFSQSTKLVTLS